jgi:hypothetical protein
MRVESGCDPGKVKSSIVVGTYGGAAISATTRPRRTTEEAASSVRIVDPRTEFSSNKRYHQGERLDERCT